MSGVFLLVPAVFAFAVPSNEPKAQNPNDPIYENQPLSLWLKKLSDKDPKVRKSAAYAMRDLGPKAKPAVPALFRMLKEDPIVGPRIWACYALAAVAPEDPTVPQVLIRAMQNDTSEGVRATATMALSEMEPKPKAVLPDLKRLLKNESPELRRNVIHVLTKIEEPENMTPILLASLGDKDADVRETIAIHLAFTENVVPALRDLLNDKKPAVKAGASLALGHWGRTCRDTDFPQIEEAIPSILVLLKNKEDYVRESAAQTFYLVGRRGLTSAVPALTSALEDDSAEVRRWSVLALGQIGSGAHPAVAGLAKLLQDQSARVRQGAAAALGRIGPKSKSAVPALISALEDSDISVRWAAASGLAGVGPDAKEALPVLRKVFKTQDQDLERETANALRNIDVTIDLKKDEEVFASIIGGWEKQFPGVNMPCDFVHETNGPSGNWIHISVPKALEPLYQHAFSREFLDQRLKEKTSFHQAIAADLLLLQQPILSKDTTHLFSVGDKEEYWQCADYRVFRTWDYVCRGRFKFPDWFLEE